VSERPGIRIRYAPSRTYTNTQNNYVGAQDTAGRRGTLPTFTDANTRHVAITGDDAAAGTAAAPYRTIQNGLDNLGGAFVYVLIQDSGVYRERPTINFAAGGAGGIYAADGETPTINPLHGAVDGTYGARISGRTQFSAGARPATFYYVSKDGNDGTGARGDDTKPFLTWQAALNDGARIANDTIEGVDDGIYDENLLVQTVAVTLQAADGNIPTIRGVAAIPGNGMIDLRVDASIYGINFVMPFDDSTNGDVIGNAGSGGNIDLSVYDCSFKNGGVAVRFTGGGACDIYHSYFDDQWASACLFQSTGAPFAGSCTVAVHNCVFERQCNNYDGIGTEVGGIDITPIDPALWCTAVITECTFRDISGKAGIYLAYSTNAGAGAITIQRCLFEENRTDKEACWGVHAVGSIRGATQLIEDCTFRNLGGGAYRSQQGAAAALGTQIIRRCFAWNCSSESPTYATYQFGGTTGGEELDTLALTVESCLSVGATGRGFALRCEAAGPATTAYLTSCVAMNSEDYSFHLATGGVHNVSYELSGCSEKSINERALDASGVGGGGTVLVIYSVFAGINVGAITTQRGYRNMDPLYLLDAPGAENPAPSVAGPCMQRNIGNRNIGIDAVVFEVTGANNDFVIDGLTFRGGTENSYDGVLMASGIANQITVRYCTFIDQYAIGSFLYSQTIIDKCEFQTKGTGISASELGGIVRRCVGYKCGSAFLVRGATLLTVNNNSAYGCGYGQYDIAVEQSAAQKNNVYSDNGVDYRGDNAQDYSCIGTIEGEGTVTNGTRLNPLFRNVTDGDLRLQTIEEGFDFNSPAKGLADDTDDAGAFSFTYGAVALTWTTVDLDANAGDPVLAYHNPTKLMRQLVPIKLAQGETNDGGFYSEAPAYRTEWTFLWDKGAAFPPAQLTDLEQVYITGEGECQLSFDDGATWIPVRVARKQKFVYTELKGATYSNDDLPTPLAKLTFRESA